MRVHAIQGLAQWRSSIAVVACLMAMACVTAHAQTDAAQVFNMLQAARQAAHKTDYSGVFTYQEDGAMHSSRLVHIVDGTGERERLEVLDGSPREFIRHNDTLQCLVPDQKVVLIQEAQTDRFPGLYLGDPQRINAHYTFTLDDHHSRVAGRDCRVIHVVPRTDDRYGYKFCVDTETNLLVKAQTLSDTRIIDEIAFTLLQVGEGVSADDLKPSFNVKGWKRLELQTRPIDISRTGWRIQVPPGFVFTTQLARPMRSGDAVKHLVLSDGLAMISVFIEPYDAAKSARLLRRGAVRNGAINVFAKRIGDYWFTVLGAVPVKTLQAVAEQSQYVDPPAAEQKN